MEVLAKRSLGDAPNLVAFTEILAVMQGLYRRSEYSVAHFVHDEQNQFAAEFSRAQAALAPYAHVDIEAPLAHVVHSDAITAGLEFRPAADSAALQIVDVLLWMLRGWWEHDKAFHDDVDALIENVLGKKLWLKEFSDSQLIESLQNALQASERAPIAGKKRAAAARNFLSKEEDARVARLREEDA